MPDRLLETKFHILPWRAGGVIRPRLLEQIQTGLNERRKLTLVSAPAGYGKTTLVTGWLDSIKEGTRMEFYILAKDANNHYAVGNNKGIYPDVSGAFFSEIRL